MRRGEEETQKVLNSAYGNSNEATLDLLRAAWAADGRLGEKNLASMEAGAAMRRVLGADIEMITGGERALTVGEAMMLADKYGFDAKHLFSKQTQAQAQIFATTNYSSEYQAQLNKEAAIRQAANPAVLSSSLLGNGGSFSLMSPLYADEPMNPQEIRERNRVVRDEFNKREYFYMGGVKYVRVGEGPGAHFEANVNGKRLTYELTENEGVVHHVFVGTKDVNRVPNASFDPDGQLWSGAQEWWSQTKSNYHRAWVGGDEPEGMPIWSDAWPAGRSFAVGITGGAGATLGDAGGQGSGTTMWFPAEEDVALFAGATGTASRGGPYPPISSGPAPAQMGGQASASFGLVLAFGRGGVDGWRNYSQGFSLGIPVGGVSVGQSMLPPGKSLMDDDTYGYYSLVISSPGKGWPFGFNYWQHQEQPLLAVQPIKDPPEWYDFFDFRGRSK